MSYRRKNNDVVDKSKSRGWTDNNNHYERHYCEVCNVWMASDRASILTHKNGKKHAEKVQEAQARKTIVTAAQEKHQAAMQNALLQMESAAAASLQQDYGLFEGSLAAAHPIIYPPTTTTSAYGIPAVLSSSRLIPPPPPPPVPISAPPPPPSLEKKDWVEKKKQRDEEKRKKRSGDADEDDGEEDASRNKRRRRKIGVKDGQYPCPLEQSHTWLEGVVFGDMLEEDMPVQVWLGSASVSNTELRLLENQRHWRDALVAAVRQRPTAEQHGDRMVVDVAYLQHSDDADERLKKSVPLQQIRILLGNDADSRIPATVEEARLLAMGGEEIVLKKPKSEETDPEIEEATGLSGWSTVKVRLTTVRNELREEREAARQKIKSAAAKAAKDAKAAEARRMEEAVVSSAHDSALGAYDVYSRSKEGYKGVDIHSAAATTDVHAFGKKLAKIGTTVGFKKRDHNGAARKKFNRRTTSAEDD